MEVIGPMRLLKKKQTFGKNGKLSSDEKTLAYFARFFECDKPQRTMCKGPEGFPAFTMEVIG